MFKLQHDFVQSYRQHSANFTIKYKILTIIGAATHHSTFRCFLNIIDKENKFIICLEYSLQSMFLFPIL